MWLVLLMHTSEGEADLEICDFFFNFLRIYWQNVDVSLSDVSTYQLPSAIWFTSLWLSKAPHICQLLEHGEAHMAALCSPRFSLAWHT